MTPANAPSASAPAAASGEVAQLRFLRGGKWESSSSGRHGDVFNPSTGKVIARVPLCTAAETAGVVETAAAAGPGWAATPAVERARVMFRFRELLMRDFDRLAATVSREQENEPPKDG